VNKKVEVYTWTFCPFCVKVKQLLESEGVDYTEHNIQGNKEALTALKERTGSGTVPQVFVNEMFYGGCDDVYDLYNDGKFDAVFK